MKKEKESLVEARVFPRDDGKVRKHAFGIKCRCVKVDHELGGVTFRQETGVELEFTIPVFGPGEYSKTRSISIEVGDECWLDLSCFRLPGVATEVN